MKFWVPVVKIKTIEVGKNKYRAAAYSADIYSAKKKKSKLRPLAIGILILFIPIIVIYLIVRQLDAPAEGSINQTPPAKAEKIDPYANPGHIDGKHISFTYPAHYKKVPSQLTGNYLEIFDFYTTAQNGRQITIGVMPGSLSENSGVSLRKSQPDKYVANPRTQNSQSFTSTGGTEMIDFIEHNNMVVSIVVISQSPADLTDNYNTIVSSLRWK